MCAPAVDTPQRALAGPDCFIMVPAYTMKHYSHQHVIRLICQRTGVSLPLVSIHTVIQDSCEVHWFWSGVAEEVHLST